MSRDKVSGERTYGAAIEVPEMVLVEVVESIQAEVTSTPRNQTRTISGGGDWVWERRHTIKCFTKVGEVSLGLARVNCSWGITLAS